MRVIKSYKLENLIIINVYGCEKRIVYWSTSDEIWVIFISIPRILRVLLKNILYLEKQLFFDVLIRIIYTLLVGKII